MKVIVYNDPLMHIVTLSISSRLKEETEGDWFKRLAKNFVPDGVEYDVVDSDKLDLRFPCKWCKYSQSTKVEWDKAYEQKMRSLQDLQEKALASLFKEIQKAEDYEDQETVDRLVNQRRLVRKCLDNLQLSSIQNPDELFNFIPRELSFDL